MFVSGESFTYLSLCGYKMNLTVDFTREGVWIMKKFKKQLRLSVPAFVMALVMAFSPIAVLAEGIDEVPPSVIYDVEYLNEKEIYDVEYVDEKDVYDGEGVYTKEIIDYAEEIIDYDEEIIDYAEEELCNEVQATLISAIDGSPFTAVFNSMTGRISMYTIYGDPIGYRYVADEEAFWGLVAVNTELTSGDITRYTSQNKTNHNIFMEQLQETYDFENGQIVPFFNTGSVFMHVPQATSPRPSVGRSVLVGGRYYVTTREHNMVTLRTHNFNHAGMSPIDVFISNHFGDDAGILYGMPSWAEVNMPIRFPGEPYGARVSSRYGSFQNVELRFFAQPEAPVHVDTVTITFNANGGIVNPTSATRVPGQTMGQLPTPSRNGHTFMGWFTTVTGGTQITSTSIVPSVNTTFFARWVQNPVIFGTSWYPTQAGTGINRNRTHTSPFFVSETGIIEVRFSHLAVPNPPAAFNAQVQVLINGTWFNLGPPTRLEGWASARRTTFTREVGVGIPARVFFSTTSTNYVRLGSGTIRSANELMEADVTVILPPREW